MGLLIAKLCISSIFFCAAFGQTRYFAKHLEIMAAHGIPGKHLSLRLAILLEILAAALLFVPRYVSWAAFTLALFTSVVTVAFYGRWFDGKEFWLEKAIQTTKNAAIVGGLIAVIALDPTRPALLSFFD
jgi:uncharacterized membrane protein YphA (DoxX/SURF4 family)